MTIPATADYFLVQNEFQLATLLPEDVIVNTFIFKNQSNPTINPGAAPGRAAQAVFNFFATSPQPEGPLATAGPWNIISMMHNGVVGWRQKVYDLGLPPGGRPPTLFNRTAELPPRSTGVNLPNEVAVVLSLQTPIIGKRGKGRVYLGPWSVSAAAVTVGGSAVTVQLRERIAAQAAVLALGNNNDMEWAVWSTTRQKFARVVGGYVDNAWDTQRRRGLKPSVRTQWGTTTPSQPANS
jgi:hypothetical protein